MHYKIFENKIEIYDKTDFNAQHIMECGQIFTYDKTEEGYLIYSKDKKAELFETENGYVIQTKDAYYFEEFFDLKTDYSNIKKDILTQNPGLKQILEYGYGIRILKQDVLEVVIGFIISANNNISRIKTSMKYIRQNLGENMGDYFAFPTLEKLSQVDAEFFTKAGVGYRASQIVKAIKQLQETDFELLKTLQTQPLRQELLKINGIGGKVADCVLLFGFYKQDVFPVDTWIEKIYHDLFENGQTNREFMRNHLVSHFKNLSGYIQQYLFYFKRSS